MLYQRKDLKEIVILEGKALDYFNSMVTLRQEHDERLPALIEGDTEALIVDTLKYFEYQLASQNMWESFMESNKLDPYGLRDSGFCYTIDVTEKPVAYLRNIEDVEKEQVLGL